MSNMTVQEKIKKEERGELMDKYISNKIKNISLIMTFFVVILHSNNLEDPSVLNINTLIQNFIGQGIVRIAVPMFFLISGYLFFYKFKPSKEAFLNIKKDLKVYLYLISYGVQDGL